MAFTLADYHFSVTIHTDNLAVVNCLRALSQFSQREGNVRIPWGGTKDADWRRDGQQVTFRFTSPEYRNGFIEIAGQVLQSGLWREVDRDENNPASPQND